MRVHPLAYVCIILKEQEANPQENIKWSELIKQTIQAKSSLRSRRPLPPSACYVGLRWKGIFESTCDVIQNKREIKNITHIRNKNMQEK